MPNPSTKRNSPVNIRSSEKHTVDIAREERMIPSVAREAFSKEVEEEAAVNAAAAAAAAERRSGARPLEGNLKGKRSTRIDTKKERNVWCSVDRSRKKNVGAPTRSSLLAEGEIKEAYFMRVPFVIDMCLNNEKFWCVGLEKEKDNLGGYDR